MQTRLSEALYACMHRPIPRIDEGMGKGNLMPECHLNLGITAPESAILHLMCPKILQSMPQITVPNAYAQVAMTPPRIYSLVAQPSLSQILTSLASRNFKPSRT